MQVLFSCYYEAWLINWITTNLSSAQNTLEFLTTGHQTTRYLTTGLTWKPDIWLLVNKARLSPNHLVPIDFYLTKIFIYTITLFFTVNVF